MDQTTIAFLLGLAGAAMNIIWPMFRSRTRMLFAQVVASFFFGTHYLLADALTGAGMNLLAMLQALLAIPLGNRPGFRIAYIAVLPLIAGVVWLSWAGLPSLFAAVGFALISLGRFQLKPIRFRILMLAAIPAWAAHNIMVGSVPGLIADCCALASGSWMLRATLRRDGDSDAKA